MVRKPFSKDEYDKADTPAKKQMLGWLGHNIPDLITDSKENFGFDIRGILIVVPAITSMKLKSSGDGKEIGLRVGKNYAFPTERKDCWINGRKILEMLT